MQRLYKIECKQYTISEAYLGNMEIKKYIDGKCVGAKIMNDYNVPGYTSALESEGFEYAEDVDEAKAIMEKAKKDYEDAVKWYEYAQKHALVKEQ